MAKWKKQRIDLGGPGNPLADCNQEQRAPSPARMRRKRPVSGCDPSVTLLATPQGAARCSLASFGQKDDGQPIPPGKLVLHRAPAAARDWQKPSAISPGLIQSTCTEQKRQPGAPGKCISRPSSGPPRGRSRCAQGQRAFLLLPQPCGALTSPWQPLSTALSPEGSRRALGPNLLRLAAPAGLYSP